MKKRASLWKSIRFGLAILAGLVVYAYGFQVTKVDLDEFRQESRQESRVRTMRALAQPDIFEYEQVEYIVPVPIYVPCPAQPPTSPLPAEGEAYLVLTPACASPGEMVQVEGFNFPPNTRGPISFVPSNDPNDKLALQRDRVNVDQDGHFLISVEIPQRPSQEVQYLRVTVRQNVGLPHFSQQAKDTWDKIVETVFLALLATTVGVIFSIPVSFLAARNLMKDVKSPLTSIALSVIGWPLGVLTGLLAARLLGSLNTAVSASLWGNLAGAVLSPLGAYALLRWSFNQTDTEQATLASRLERYAGMLLASIFGCFTLFQAGSLLITVGRRLAEPLGFMGNFIYQSGDILRTTAPLVIALVAGAVLGSLLSKLGQWLNEILPLATLKIANLLLAGLAGFLLFTLIGVGVNWLYEINRPLLSIWIPGMLGALGGLLLAGFTRARQPLRTGLVIYTITRTILNALRSIEAIIMAIVAVIWVGIGPFAGTLALALHTVAALAKLYSEQVESILPGPLEAVQATGANRLQTIIYAVIPQIIPPYISFTMYRWDINVRMSTIIGFAGGGGIGFLLQQNINLMNYRGASTQMVAIAIVVASMDYLSSYLRERFV